MGVWAPASCYMRCLMQQGATQELLGVPSEALLAFKEGGMLVSVPVLAYMPTNSHAAGQRWSGMSTPVLRACECFHSGLGDLHCSLHANRHLC